MNWKYHKHEIKSIEDLKRLSKAENPLGIIYQITLSNGMRYVGKKNLFSVRKKPLGKKVLASITDKRLKKYEVITKESDWMSYNGSSKLLIDAIKNNKVSVVKREILEVATTKNELTYLETKHLFLNDVLGENSDSFYNDNILGKFYKKNK